MASNRDKSIRVRSELTPSRANKLADRVTSVIDNNRETVELDLTQAQRVSAFGFALFLHEVEKRSMLDQITCRTTDEWLKPICRALSEISR